MEHSESIWSAVATSRANLGWHEFFMRWNKTATELNALETELRSRMDPVVERAVKGKRIALFEEMLKQYQYPDGEVVQELKEGASLTGEVQETDMLPFKYISALLTCEELQVHFSLRNFQILANPAGSGDADIDAKVWRQTLSERDVGWLKVPVPLDEIPELAPISKRFGLKQKHKVRLIDDFLRVIGEWDRFCL